MQRTVVTAGLLAENKRTAPENGRVGRVRSGAETSPMHTLRYGQTQVECDLDREAQIVGRRGSPLPPLTNLPAALEDALEQPVGFPPLRRALTPDDHVVLALDEGLPRLGFLLGPILEYVITAGISPAAITLLLPPESEGQSWLDDLPEEFEDVHIETHDPTERKKLSYVAMTRGGRRVYINRSAVDADQLIVVCRPDSDPLVSRGGVGLLFPALADQATRLEMVERQAHGGAQLTARTLREESTEVAWLLGAPFLIQILEGSGDDIVRVVAGPIDAGETGQNLYETQWQRGYDCAAQTVVATVRGTSTRHDFATLARALTHAARVVQPEGRIILLTEAAPRLGPGVEILRGLDDPSHAADLLRRRKPPDLAAAMQWAAAAEKAHISLLSRLPSEVAEELFTTPLDHASQVARLVTGGSYLILEDADKALPYLDEDEDDFDE